MKEIWNKIYTNTYTNLEWIFIKIVFISLWLKPVSIIINSFQTVPIPQGICEIVLCEILLTGYFKMIMIVLISITSIFYVLEIKQIYTCLILFTLSTLLFTIEESNGILNRNSIFTFVFFAQFLAYLLYKRDLKSNLRKNRIQFSVQVIAAGYTLSALSKLFTSGISWIQDGRQITLQILKSHYYSYFDNQNIAMLEKGSEMVYFIENHYIMIQILLGSSLVLEFFSLIAITSKKNALIYGLLLTSMHIGIYYVMDILISGIVYPMVLFMVNPYYKIWILLSTLFNKFKLSFMNSLKLIK